MTREETKKVLMIIQAAYPNYKPQDKTIAVNTWFEMLEDFDERQVEAAIKAYILSNASGFPPSIGQIIEKLQLFEDSDDLNEIAAWQLTLKAIRNSIYNANGEYAKLPKCVQKAVVNPSQLREWATMEDLDGKAMIVLQSNFMRTYRTEMLREKELKKLSPDLLKFVQDKTEKIGKGQRQQEGIEKKEKLEAERREGVPMPAKAVELLRQMVGSIAR